VSASGDFNSFIDQPEAHAVRHGIVDAPPRNYSNGQEKPLKSRAPEAETDQAAREPGGQPV
jgi:hypothetical protein